MVSGDGAARMRETVGGKYKLFRLIGTGGMGAVYEAENTWTRRRVAIKILNADLAQHPEITRRFMQEAQSASRIAHPNIVDVLDMGQEPSDGALFIVQELLDGEDLRERLARERRIAPREALAIIVPIMQALAAVHAKGIFHRDVKPENIFLTRGPGGKIVPKLIDFGVAKVTEVSAEPRTVTRTGIAVGTPAYMSPEQARGDAEPDGRADVWAVGIVLFEMLSGRCPFNAATDNLMIVKIITEPAPRLDVFAPHVARDLADAIHRALETNRERRYANMTDFAHALSACSLEPGEALARASTWKIEAGGSPNEPKASPVVAINAASESSATVVDAAYPTFADTVQIDVSARDPLSPLGPETALPRRRALPLALVTAALVASVVLAFAFRYRAPVAPHVQPATPTGTAPQVRPPESPPPPPAIAVEPPSPEPPGASEEPGIPPTIAVPGPAGGAARSTPGHRRLRPRLTPIGAYSEH